MPKCPQCGQDVIGGKTVCPYCGGKLTRVQTSGTAQKSISVISDDDIIESGTTKGSNRPVGGLISLSAAVFSLIGIGIFLFMGLHQSGTEDWAGSTIAILFMIMVLAIIGIMSGLVGLNHPKKLPSIIGLVLGGVFVVILGFIIAFSLK